MKWKEKLISDIDKVIKSEGLGNTNVKKKWADRSINIHLAIFNEPFLRLMYDNKKTIESRFSINNVVPYNRIFEGDMVFVKRSGGDIEAVFVAKEIWFLRNIDAVKIKYLEEALGDMIGWNIDPEFLSNKKYARYLTLIGISNLIKIPHVSSEKKDKMGWSVIRLGYRNTLFESKT
jgi:hypothetical protein